MSKKIETPKVDLKSISELKIIARDVNTCYEVAKITEKIEDPEGKKMSDLWGFMFEVLDILTGGKFDRNIHKFTEAEFWDIVLNFLRPSQTP